MSEHLRPEEVETLKERFRAAGCTVTGLGDTEFELVGGDEFPLRCHVAVDPYFIALTTILAAAGRGFMPNRRSKIHAFLNDINLAAKLVKFTLDADMQDPKAGGWFITASVRFVTGVAGGNYDSGALRNLVTLWFQDIAELIRADGQFVVRGML